jgi:hypothetical protein
MLSQLTLSHAATRTANAEGHSAQKPVASPVPEILQKRAALIHRPVDGSDRPIGFALSRHCVALAAKNRRGAKAARSDDIIELARWRRSNLPGQSAFNLSGQGDA